MHSFCSVTKLRMVLMQWALSRQLSICNATIPGTHNSAIDLADGYGNLDTEFQQYFAWIRWIVSPISPFLEFNLEAFAAL